MLFVSVMLFSSTFIGCLIDLAWIFATSLIQVRRKCKSNGGIPAATSTVSVPAVPGSPMQRHRAFQIIDPYSMIGRTTVPYRRRSLLVDTLPIPFTSLMTFNELLAFLVTFCMCVSKLSCSSRVIPSSFSAGL